MKYIGIDLHKRYFVSSVMDEGGRLIRRDKVSVDKDSVRHYFQKVRDGDSVKAVIEACRNWSYLYDELDGLLDEVVLAHPYKTRAIAEARIKTDSLDADTLAHLLRGDLIAKAYAPSTKTREIKNVIRFRAALVQISTSIKNRVHVILDRNEIKNDKFNRLSDKFSKKGKEMLRCLNLRNRDSEMVNDYIDLLDIIEKKIKSIDENIKEIGKKDSIVKLLKTIPGVGDFVALLLRYEIDDIRRFASHKKLCSYAGLVPSTYSSGGKTYHGRLTKQGNRWIRWALTQSAKVALRNDDYLRNYYINVKKRSGANGATMALARKLLLIAYKIWITKKPYYMKSVAVILSCP